MLLLCFNDERVCASYVDMAAGIILPCYLKCCPHTLGVWKETVGCLYVAVTRRPRLTAGVRLPILRVTVEVICFVDPPMLAVACILDSCPQIVYRDK